MKELILFIIIFFLGWLFLYLPVMGFAYIFLGEYVFALLHLLPLLCLIGVFLYRHFITEPEKTRMAALRRMYLYPQRLGKRDTVNHWHSKFIDAIHGGLVSCTDPDKKSDLIHCEHIVDTLEKDCIFKKLHRVFRLTGCHMKIKDSTGHTITKIV